MKSRSVITGLLVTMFTGTAAFVGCGGDENTNNGLVCGEGTVQSGGQCVVNAAAGSAGSSGGSANGSAGAGGQVTPTTPPTFAGAESASPISTTGLLITWKAATDSVTPPERIRYRIYTANQSGQFNFAAPTKETAPGATSIKLFGLTAMSDYFVVVRAVNEGNIEDTNSKEVSARPQTDITAPTFAGATKAETAGAAAVKLSWAPAMDDLTSAAGIQYYVYVSDQAGKQPFSGAPFKVSPPGASELIVDGLSKPETKYYFVVRAGDAAGNIDTNKLEVNATSGPDKNPPVFGGCTSATAIDAATIAVKWEPASDDVTPAQKMQYSVYASEKPGEQDYNDATVMPIIGGSEGTVTGLKPGTTYYVTCRARDEAGNIDLAGDAAEWDAKTASDSSPPVFGGVTGSLNTTTSSVDLTWAPATDDQTPQEEIVYQVYSTTTKGMYNFMAEPTAVSQPGATQATVSGLSANTAYYFTVLARDKAGNRNLMNPIETDVITTFVSFNENVSPIFSNSCAVPSCHVGATAPNGLQLEDYGKVQFSAIGKDAAQIPQKGGMMNGKMFRIAPGSRTESYLYYKILGDTTVIQAGFAQMPLAPTQPLSDIEIETIGKWIDQGAQNN
jgi:hypothetical protein